MNNHRTLIRFFTISDYEEEEIWLRRQHQKGWKLVKMIVPCFYIFESCTPEDVVYRLDYKNNSENGDYFQIFQDYGWEYFARCTGWLYFRRPVSEADTEEEKEIFSDDSSRFADAVTMIFAILLLIYLYLFLHCGLKLRRLKKKYGDVR